MINWKLNLNLNLKLKLNLKIYTTTSYCNMLRMLFRKSSFFYKVDYYSNLLVSEILKTLASISPQVA